MQEIFLLIEKVKDALIEEIENLGAF